MENNVYLFGEESSYDKLMRESTEALIQEEIFAIKKAMNKAILNMVNEIDKQST